MRKKEISQILCSNFHRNVIFTETCNASRHALSAERYRGTSLIRNRNPLGPYSRTTPRALWRSYGGGGDSLERGTPVAPGETFVEGSGKSEIVPYRAGIEL